jgi:hypothetical protein
MGPIGAGASVVDIGGGARVDLLLAAQSVGPGGRAIGVDMTEAMAARARESAGEVGVANAALSASNSGWERNSARNRLTACHARASERLYGHRNAAFRGAGGTQMTRWIQGLLMVLALAVPTTALANPTLAQGQECPCCDDCPDCPCC